MCHKALFSLDQVMVPLQSVRVVPTGALCTKFGVHLSSGMGFTLMLRHLSLGTKLAACSLEIQLVFAVSREPEHSSPECG